MGHGTDALFAGMVVPQLFINIVSGSLGFVLVPMLSTVVQEAKTSVVWSFATGIAVIFGAIAFVLWIFAPWWIRATLPGFNEVVLGQTANLARIQLLGMVFTGMAAPFNAAYQAQNIFIQPALMSVMAALASIIFVVLFLEVGGLKIAAWGLFLRSLLLFILQIPIGFPFSRPKFKDQQLLESLRKLRTLIAGSIYYKTDQILDRYLASMAQVGSVSLLHLAQQIYGACNLVFASAIAAPAMPILSRHIADENVRAFEKIFFKTLAILSVVGVITYGLIVFLGHKLLFIVFGNGVLETKAIDDLWLLMISLGMVWIFGLTGQIISSAFYAMADTITPTRIGVAGFTLGIALKVVGFYFYGVIGIAIATGVYTLINSVAMGFILLRRLGQMRFVPRELNR